MKTLRGTVTSLKNKKTVVVTVETKQLHPLYKKYMKSTKKYACHTEGDKLEMGQNITITECRPISKTKRFKVAIEPKAEKKSAEVKK
jgi:small subunit ribosomal protein S17